MRKLTILVLFSLVTLTWGTTWLAMQIAAETIPPVFATGMRFMFAAPFLICIACLRIYPFDIFRVAYYTAGHRDTADAYPRASLCGRFKTLIRAAVAR